MEIISAVHILDRNVAHVRLLLWCAFDLFRRGTSIGPFNPSAATWPQIILPPHRRLPDGPVCIYSLSLSAVVFAVDVGHRRRIAKVRLHRIAREVTAKGSTRGRLIAPFHLTFRLWLPPAPYLTHCLPSGPLLMRVTKFPMSALSVLINRWIQHAKLA